jgi:hypothetical protein
LPPHARIDDSIPNVAKDAIKNIIHITFALLQACNTTSFILVAPHHIASFIRDIGEALACVIDSRI